MEQRELNSPIYDLLYPSIYTYDLFELRVIPEEDAIQLCRDILKLFEEEEPSIKNVGKQEIGYEFKHDFVQTIVKEKFTVYQPSIIINNQPVIINKSHIPDEIEKDEKGHKDEKSEGISLEQASTVDTVVAPLAAHYIFKDYTYQLYEKIEKNYDSIKTRLKDTTWLQSNDNSEKTETFLNVIKLFEDLRKKMLFNIKNDAKVEAVGGLGLITTGLSLVFSSSFGVFAGLAMAGFAASKMICWEKNIRNQCEDNLDNLISNCKNFLAFYK